MILGIYNHSGWSGECMTCHILFLSRPFWATVCKMVPLCYQTAVCPVYDVGVLWPNGWMDHGSPLQKGHSPQFSAHICCGQKAGCIKDSTWYGGRPRPRRHCVRWGPCPPPKKGAHHPQFWPIYCRQMAAWIKMPLGGEIGLGPGHIVLHGAQLPPSSPPRKGLSSRLFWHKSIVAKWSLISATAEVLFLITVFLGLHSVCTDEQFWRYTRCVSVQRGAFWDCVVSDHHLGGHIPQNAFWENRHFQAYLVKY